MKQFQILLRREFWEHRNTFIVLPGVVAGFMILVMAGLFITSGFTSVNAHVSISGDNVSEEWRIDADHASMDEAIGLMLSNLRQMSEAQREHRLFNVFHALSVPFFIVLMVVVLFYLLGTLYEERKDRSILFWKSMPVSDLASEAINKNITWTIATQTRYTPGTATSPVNSFMDTVARSETGIDFQNKILRSLRSSYKVPSR